MLARMISCGITPFEAGKPGTCASGAFPDLKCLTVGWFPTSGYCRIGALVGEP